MRFSPNPRARRGVAIGFSLITVVSTSHAQAVIRPGRYEFSAVASGNREFQGTLHLTSIDGALGGRLISSLVTPIPFTRVAPQPGGVEINGALDAGRTLTLKLDQRGDSLV